MILRKDGGGSRSGSLTKTGTTNEFNGLDPNRTFYFRVWDNAPDNSGYIDEISITVHYSSPAVISITAPNSSSKLVKGQPFTVRWSYSGSEKLTIEYFKTSTWHTITSTARGGSYNWTVPTSLYTNLQYSLRIRSNTYSSRKATVSFSVQDGCFAPTSSSSLASGSSDMIIRWNRVTEATSGYKIQYKKSSEISWKTKYIAAVSYGSNGEYKITGLESATLYNYRIYSRCASGESSNYKSGSFTSRTQCTSPAGLQAYNLNETTASVRWNSVSGGSPYIVGIKKTTQTWSEVDAKNVVTTFRHFSDLDTDTSYQVRVSSNCDPSNYTIVSFKTLQPNRSPSNSQFVSVPSQANTGQSVTVSVRSGTDPDGDQVKFHLTSPSSNYTNASPYKSQWFSSSGGQANISLTWSTPGNHTIYITSFDRNGNSSGTISKQIIINTPANNSPSDPQFISIPSQANTGKSVTVSVRSGTDPDGDQVKFHLTSPSSNYTNASPYKSQWFSSSGGQANISLTWSTPGNHTIYITSFDRNGNSSRTISKQINVTTTSNLIVNLHSPNNGSYDIGSQMTIRWSSTNQHHYGIYLYKGGISVSKQIATIRLTNKSYANSYVWTIPTTVRDKNGNLHTLNGNDYKIKVAIWDASGAAVGDYSDGNLSLQPDSGITPVITKVYTALDKYGNPILEGIAGQVTTLNIEGSNLPNQLIVKVLQLGIEEEFDINQGKGHFNFELKNTNDNEINIILKTPDNRLQTSKTLLLKQATDLQVEVLEGPKYKDQTFNVTIQEYIGNSSHYPNKDNGFQRAIQYTYEYNVNGGNWKPLGTTSVEYVTINQINSKFLQLSIPEVTTNCRIRVKDNYYNNILGVSKSFQVLENKPADIDISLEWDAGFNDSSLENPIGVSADGVSRILVKVSNKNPSNPVHKVSLSLENSSGQSDPAQDGLGYLMVSTVTPDQYSNEANSASLQNIVDTRRGLKDYYYWYKSPEDFSTNKQNTYHNDSQRRVDLKVKIEYVGGLTIKEQRSIIIVRPPLVFAHGLGGDASTWNHFSFDYISSSSVQRFIDDPRYIITKAINIEPNADFRHNARLLVLPNSVAGYKKTVFGGREITSLPDVLKSVRKKGYSSVQVDYVAHSMGGCILRVAEHYNRNLFYVDKPKGNIDYTNYGNGLVKKAITLNTPHNGSEIADLLNQMVDALNKDTFTSASDYLIIDNYIKAAVKVFSNGLTVKHYAKRKGLSSFIQPKNFHNNVFKSTLEITPAVKNLQISQENGGMRFS